MADVPVAVASPEVVEVVAITSVLYLRLVMPAALAECSTTASTQGHNKGPFLLRRAYGGRVGRCWGRGSREGR